jgi:hypothetical protein
MRRLVVAAGALLAVAAMLFGTSAQAQGTIAGWPHGAADISKGRSVHLGDDPAYAEPGFDDSGWQKVDLHRDPLPSEIVSQGHARWYRLRLHVPDGPGVKELLLTGQLGAFEVYVNGNRTGPGIRTSFSWISQRPMLYVLDGVVEAMKADTGEFFGFERTRDVSQLSAVEITNSARDFGQNDDITVLTVNRLAVAAL